MEHYGAATCMQNGLGQYEGVLGGLSTTLPFSVHLKFFQEPQEESFYLVLLCPQPLPDTWLFNKERLPGLRFWLWQTAVSRSLFCFCYIFFLQISSIYDSTIKSFNFEILEKIQKNTQNRHLLISYYKVKFSLPPPRSTRRTLQAL